MNRPALLYSIPTSRCPDCGKVSYQSRKDARKSARLLHPGHRMRAYRHLGRWHLTSQSAKTVTAFRDRLQHQRGRPAA